jgi:hypothetical protein
MPHIRIRIEMTIAKKIIKRGGKSKEFVLKIT